MTLFNDCLTILKRLYPNINIIQAGPQAIPEPWKIEYKLYRETNTIHIGRDCSLSIFFQETGYDMTLNSVRHLIHAIESTME